MKFGYKNAGKVKIDSINHHAFMVFVLVFAGIGSALIIASRAATGACSTTGVVGSTSHSVSVPETSQYKVWVRMQVPGTDNTNNTNGVRLELAGNQCFTLTTANSSNVNQWQWVNTSATSTSTPQITSQISAGTINAKVYGMKSGVKVDKVLLLKSDSTCIPSNDFTSGSPGDNCTVSAPVITFYANPSSVTSGGSSTLNWNASEATSCTASNAWSGSKTTSGSESTGTLTASKTYVLSCSGLGGSTTASLTVTVASDTTPPSISITNPATNVTITGSVNLSANASDNIGVTSVAFYLDNSLSPIATDTTSPYSATWNSIGVANGSHTIVAKAKDAAGNTGTSAAVNVTVSNTAQDTTNPTAAITAPASGTTVQGIGTVSVNAGDNIAVSRVELLIDDVLRATDYTTPYGFSWDTTKFINGSHSLRARAYDAAGNVGNSTILTINVNNTSEGKDKLGDANGDGVVNVKDISIILYYWGSRQTARNYGDLNGDGVVNIYDISILLANWGQ